MTDSVKTLDEIDGNGTREKRLSYAKNVEIWRNSAKWKRSKFQDFPRCGGLKSVLQSTDGKKIKSVFKCRERKMMDSSKNNQLARKGGPRVLVAHAQTKRYDFEKIEGVFSIPLEVVKVEMPNTAEGNVRHLKLLTMAKRVFSNFCQFRFIPFALTRDH